MYLQNISLYSTDLLVSKIKCKLYNCVHTSVYTVILKHRATMLYLVKKIDRNRYSQFQLLVTNDMMVQAQLYP